MSTDIQPRLFELPPTDGSTLPYSERDSFQKGDACETLVAAKIACWGYPTVKSSPGSVYDLIVELAGKKFLTIQVKSKATVSTKMEFDIKRTSSREGPKHFKYQRDDYHITAVVSLPDQKVLFFPGVRNRLKIYREQFLREGNEYQSWLSAIEAYSIKKEYI